MARLDLGTLLIKANLFRSKILGKGGEIENNLERVQVQRRCFSVRFDLDVIERVGVISRMSVASSSTARTREREGARLVRPPRDVTAFLSETTLEAILPFLDIRETKNNTHRIH